jgi:hypothetical protein
MNKISARKYMCRVCRNYHCHWCGSDVIFGEETPAKKVKLATKEHLVPLSEGGSNHRRNIAIACKKCNNHRGSDTTWVAFHDHKADPEKMSPTQRLVFGLAKVTILSRDELAKLSTDYSFYSQSNPGLHTCLRCGLGYNHLRDSSHCAWCFSKIKNPTSKKSSKMKCCTACKQPTVPAHSKSNTCRACEESATQWQEVR